MTPETLESMPIEQRFRLFVQWLGNQPRDGRYVFSDVQHCAMCQFAKTVLDGDYIWISAGPTDITVRKAGGGNYAIELIPKLSGYALHRNVFGRAYDGFALTAGLPRRSKWQIAILRLLAMGVKRKNPLAA